MYDVRQFAVKAVKHIGKTFGPKKAYLVQRFTGIFLKSCMDLHYVLLSKFLETNYLLSQSRRRDLWRLSQVIPRIRQQRLGWCNCRRWNEKSKRKRTMARIHDAIWEEGMFTTISQLDLPVTLARLMIIISVLSFEYHQKWNTKRKLQFLVIASLAPVSANDSPSDAVSCGWTWS